MSNQHAGLKAVLPLLLVVLIDSIGMAIIFPILTPVFMEPNGILPLTASLHLRNVLYGVTICAFPCAMFFGTPVLGDLSDQIGRKKILLICLIGVGASYFLSGLAIIIPSIGLLIVSRLIAGAFAGSMAAAQAAVIDVSPAEDKAKNISRLLFPAALGFVIGPLLGSFLSDKNLVSWFGFWTPMFVAGGLAFLNALFLWYGFHETHERKGKLHFKIHRGVEIFIEAFKSHEIRTLSIIFLGLELAWSIYFQFISLFLLSRYHFSANGIGFFMAMLGVGFSIAMLYGVTFLTQRFKNHKIALYTFLISTVCFGVTILPDQIALVWVSGFVLALAMAVAYPVLITLYSDLVGAERQGWVMGVNNAVVAVAWAVTGATGGFFSSINEMLGLLIGGVIMALTAIGMFIYNKSKHVKVA